MLSETWRLVAIALIGAPVAKWRKISNSRLVRAALRLAVFSDLSFRRDVINEASSSR